MISSGCKQVDVKLLNLSTASYALHSNTVTENKQTDIHH